MSHPPPSSLLAAAPDVQSFQGFRKLATELQLTIWRHAIPNPRILRVKVYASDTPYDEKFRARHPAHYFDAIKQAAIKFELSCKSFPCGLLGACRASRDVILEVYTSTLPLTGGRILRFDGNHDTILLYHNDRNLPLIPGHRLTDETYLPKVTDYQRVFRDVENLALSLDALSEHTLLSERFRRDSDAIWTLSRFTSLKKVFLYREGKGKSGGLSDDQAEFEIRTLEESTASLCETIEQFKDVQTQRKAIEKVTPREMARHIKVEDVRVSVVHIISTAPNFDSAYSAWVMERSKPM